MHRAALFSLLGDNGRIIDLYCSKNIIVLGFLSVLILVWHFLI
jgi:hypothetical protein